MESTPKRFDDWNVQKKKIDADIGLADFHEREIWWCAIGVNVGSEQHSESGDFGRPVLVVKKFTRTVFWGIPFTTKVRDIDFRFRFNLEEVENDLLLLQMRAFDRKRLLRKIGFMPKNDFRRLLDVLKKFL